MIYEQKFHSKFKSDLRNIDKSVIQKIKDIHLANIINNPLQYEKLKGNLFDFYSYHFKENRVDYRIAYKIIDENTIVVYYMVAKRENFYKNLEKRV